MKKLPDSVIVALLIFASMFGSIGASMAQTLAPLITPYVNESDMASVGQIFNSDPDVNTPDISLRYVHDGLDIVPTGNLKPFRAACSGRVHWVLAFDDAVNVMIECNSTYTLEYNFEPQSAQTGQTQLVNIAVVEGQSVSQGDVIGSLYVANALAHVHFAVLKNWVSSCPEQYFDSGARNSILNLVHVRFPGTGMCHGGDVTPAPLATPYVNESDMASANEAFSADGSTSPWGFVHNGIDFFPIGNLKPFQAACTGVVNFVRLQQNNVTSNWQVNLIIICNPYVLDPNIGGYFSPIAVEYIFEPRSTVQTDGQTQFDNITIANGQAVSQGDVIGYLHAAGEGAHVHFGTIPLGSMLAFGVPSIPSCPEPQFASEAKTSILNLLHVVWPGASMCYFSVPQITLPTIEFYNTNLDNYFITADSNEAAQIDGGSAGPGWIRTGNSFKSGGSTPVCRFYGSQWPGPNSHFYTVDAVECAYLKQLQASTPATEKRWNFESLDFVSTAPTNSTCPSGTVPVYRAYNNGFARGVDSNHRITSSTTAIQEVVTRGWSSEGVVMCAPN